MKTTYFNGDLARYTGKTETIHGGLFYEIELLEGHLKGQLKVTQRATSKENAMFEFDGSQYTLEVMLDSNAHDEEFCAWARSAAIEDNFCGCVRDGRS